MALANTDALIAALGAGYTTSFSWAAPVNAVVAGSADAGGFNSSWITGHIPGTIPASGTTSACTSATLGALPLPPLSAPGNNYYLGQVSHTTFYYFALMDRNAHFTVPTTGTSFTPTGLAVAARSGAGHGVTLWAELAVNTVAAGTSVSWPGMTVTYTNSDGVTGRTGTLGRTNGTTYTTSGQSYGGMVPMELATGDRGVSSVQRINLLAATGATLTFVVHLSRPVYMSGSQLQSTGITAGFFDIGGAPLGADPCLFAAGGTANNSNAGTPYFGTARIIQG